MSGTGHSAQPSIFHTVHHSQDVGLSSVVSSANTNKINAVHIHNGSLFYNQNSFVIVDNIDEPVGY